MRPELGALGLHVLLQQERAGADGLLGDVALERLGHDHGRVVEQVLRHGDLARVQVQLDGVVVHLLDAGRLEVAHQAEHRGADLRVEPLLEVEDHVVGGQLLAVVELDALLEEERPGLQIVATSHFSSSQGTVMLSGPV